MQTVILIGAQDVLTAGNTMRHAAEEMHRAASIISNSLEAHQRFLDDWLLRYQTAMQGEKAGYG